MVQSAVHWLLWSDMRVLLQISQLALLQHSPFVVQTTTANPSRIIRQNTTTTLFPSGCLYIWPFRLYSHHHRRHRHLAAFCPISTMQKSRENETENWRNLDVVVCTSSGKQSRGTVKIKWQHWLRTVPSDLHRPALHVTSTTTALSPSRGTLLSSNLPPLVFLFPFLKQKNFFETIFFFPAQSRNLVHNVSLAATFNRSLWSLLLFFFRCPPNSQAPLPLSYYYFPLPKLDETLIFFWICRTNFIL